MFPENAMHSPVLVIDTESNGYDFRHDSRARLMGIAIAYKIHGDIQAEYWAIDELTEEWRNVILTHPRLVFHNAKYDLVALACAGIDVMSRPFYDTMLMGHWVDENMPSKSLDWMSKRYGGKPKLKSKEMAGIIKKEGWGAIPLPMMREYSANDAFITYELWEKLYPIFCREGYDGRLWDYEQRFVRLIIKMESYGVRIDEKICTSEIVEGTNRMNEITRELNVNVGSREHLEILLLDILKLKPYKLSTKTGKPSFDKESMDHYESELESRDDPTARRVLEYRGWQKAVSSYFQSYLSLRSKSGDVHPSFKLHGTRTGRLSCEKPNLQQMPRKSARRWSANAKRVIVPRNGWRLYEADYANLEFRLGAIYSSEPNMVRPLQQGAKPFDAMAELLHGPHWTPEQRQDCKTETYMTSYGAGPDKIATVLRILPEEARRRRTRFWAAYPGLQRITHKAQANATERGYAPLWTGRRRHLPWKRETHKAFNSIIQGGAAELVKRIMLRLDMVLDWSECRMLLQVHDSVVFEIRMGREDYWLPIIRAVMEDVGSLHDSFKLVPFPVDIKAWGQ
jgi:DNA polymerase-1